MPDYSPRCSACPGPTFDKVPGDGPQPSRLVFIGAGPGKREDRTLIPYSGQAGDELNNTYLPIAGLRREEVWIDNCMSCWTGLSKTPSPTACLTCAMHHLPRTLGQVKPEVVVLMGGAAMGVSDTRVRLEMQHGHPFWGSVLKGTWEGWVVPMYEPALGIRETSKMSQLLDDFRHLGQWMRGEWTPPKAPEVEKDYQLINTVDELKDYVASYVAVVNGLSLPTFANPPVDAETDGGKPWSVQFSLIPNTGRMVLATNKAVLEALAWWMERWTILLHNAPGDLDTLEKMRYLGRMGLRPAAFYDTMQESYHQCSLPQGLKPLAFRLLGVTMRSWADVVWPASIAAIESWIEDGIGLAQSNLQDTEVTYLKMGVCPNCGKRGKAERCKVCDTPVSFTRTEYKPGAAQAILRHVLNHTDATADDDKPYDPWKALARMRVEGLRGKVAEGWEWDWLEGELGKPPILSIANCDLTEAANYGCSDADHCGQVAAELEKGRSDPRWTIAEEDRDV